MSHAKATTDSTLPIFQGLFLKASWTDNGGKLELFSMKAGAKSLFTIPATVTEEGFDVVRGEQLLSGLHGQKADKLVTFNFSKTLSRPRASCNGSSFGMVTLDGKQQFSQNLKALPVASADGPVYDVSLLRGAIKRAAWCAKDSSNITVSALDFKTTPEGYKVFASDGYIAVRVEVRTDHASNDQVILRESLETLNKFLSVDPDSQVHLIQGPEIDGLVRETFFRAPGCLYGSNVCVDTMPNIEPIFFKRDFLPQREVLVTKSSMASALGRIAGFVEKGIPSVKLSLRGSVLTLSTASEDGDCVEKLEVIYSDNSKLKESAEATVVYVSSVYLLKVLSSIESEVIVIGMRNAMSPLIVSDEQNDEINTRYVIMTVRGNFEAKDEETAEVSVVVPAPVGEVLAVEQVFDGVDTSELLPEEGGPGDFDPGDDDSGDDEGLEEAADDRSTSNELPVGSV